MCAEVTLLSRLMFEMDKLSLLILVFGFLLIVGFIVNGFYRGRQNRAALVRDPRTENLAQELSPTTNEVSEKIGAVDIVQSNIEEATVPNIEDFDAQNVGDNKVTPLETAEAQPTTKSQETKTSLIGRLKNIFSKKAVTPKQVTVTEEPQSQYFVSLKAPDGQEYAATDVDAICREYMFQLRDMNIYYHENEGRTVFGICGNTEPYGFADENLDQVHYKILNLFMYLPDRGYAENNYVEMVSFGYIITQKLGGTMVNENSEPIDETMVNRVRDVLLAYDNLA